ncbi:MAG: DUF4926 domain-containing protein [Gemmatimonadota bacterium]
MTAELDSVVLTRSLPDHGLEAGDIGTVVFVYPGGSELEVEFVTAGGATVAVLSLAAGDVRPMGPNEIHHVRALPTT